MTKNLYILLIILLGLIGAAIILNSIIFLQVGAQIFTLGSYIAWFTLLHITAVAGSVLLLKYYHYRGYRVAFVALIIAIVTDLIYAVVIYAVLTSGGLRDYYMPAFLISVGGVILYGASLTFSATGKRIWLKLAGVLGLALGLILAAAVVAHMYPQYAGINSSLAVIIQWAPISSSLIYLFFIMNFLGEIRELNAGNTAIPQQKSLEGIFGVLALLALVFAITVGTLLTSDSYDQLHWTNYNAGQAQQMVKLAGGPKTFADSKGNSLQYILIKPLNYDPQKKYPLVVSLPYGGYEASAAELLTSDSNRKEYPAFIFVPYCPDGKGWGGIPGYPSLDSLVYETINALAEPGIDVKRRYVTGLSRGAYGTWQFICTRPDMFAAAIPVSGGGDPKLAPKAVNVAVWAFHGAQDRNVPVSGSRDMIAALKKAGGHPEYTEFPNEGHNVWERVSKTPGLLDWLFAQKQQ